MECWGFESRKALPGEGFGLLIEPTPQQPSTPQTVSVTLRPVGGNNASPTVLRVPITDDGQKTSTDVSAIAAAIDEARLAPGQYDATWNEGSAEIRDRINVPARQQNAVERGPAANTNTSDRSASTVSTTNERTRESPAQTQDPQADRTNANAALANAEANRVAAEAARIGAYSQMGGVIGQTLVGLQNASANQILAAHSYGGVGGFGGGGFGDGIGFGTPAPFGGIGGGFGGYGGGYGVGIDLSNNGFMIGQNSLDARAQKRAYDRIINQLLAAIKMGNIDMIRSALTFVTLKSKTTLIEASLHMVKAMQYYDTQTQQVVDQMGQIANRTNQDHAPGANNQPDNTNAQLGSLNARMNQYSMSRTAITNLTRDIMTMVQEMGDLENSVYSKRDRDSMHYRWA